MTTDIIEINNFIVLIDRTDAQEAEMFQCELDNDIIGISFYGSGKIEIEVNDGNAHQILKSHKGMALSFFGNEMVRFSHRIFQTEPLLSVSIFSTVDNIKKLPINERDLFDKHLGHVCASKANFELGPQVFMSPDMHRAILKICHTPLQGPTKLLFLKSQVLELLSHYFGQIDTNSQADIKPEEIDKMYQAKDIILENMNQPPSLSELSKLVGVNNNKLKKNFKQLFGVPVFKYLQNQRLQKAHQLLNGKDMTVQEVAWIVGYESLSSFSNAFYKQYGFRPSILAK